MIHIEEGHFFEGELNGFGRRLSIDLEMRVTELIGCFSRYQQPRGLKEVEHLLHGYGRTTLPKPNVEKDLEGLFENGIFRQNKEDIQSYNPNVDIISKKYDLN